MDTDLILSMTSIFALIISTASIVFTIIHGKRQTKHNEDSIKQQKEHNMNSVKLLCDIRLQSKNDRLSIVLRSVGTGPMTIKKFYYYDKKDKKYGRLPEVLSKEHSKSNESYRCTWLSPLNITLEASTGNLDLFVFERRGDESDECFKESKLRHLKDLGELTVFVGFEDVYGRRFEYEKSLEFFKRMYEKATGGV
ncbi:MAG: hypothetical protein FWB98_06565 [Defluviitaleaceae bacterium]|nr:hypothetical protein [Defluviitaleaceae bacterium]